MLSKHMTHFRRKREKVERKVKGKKKVDVKKDYIINKYIMYFKKVIKKSRKKIPEINNFTLIQSDLDKGEII